LNGKPKVSIVMPVYCVEKYLEKSIKSVLTQTFSDFELLLIDDCSTDGSLDICRRFAEEDSRIKVISLEKNGGVSRARNHGIGMCEGEYIIFLDSDDYFDKNLLEKAVESMEKNPADAVVFGLVEEYYDKNGRLYKTKKIALEDKTLKTKEEVRKEILSLEESTLYGYPWNKLFNLEKLRESGALFPVMAFNEDIIFNIDFFSYAESLNIMNFSPYRYAKRSGSKTGKFISTYYQDIMVKIDRLYGQLEDFGMLDEKSLSVIASLYVRYFFSALTRSFDRRANMSKAERKSFFDREIQNERFEKLFRFMNGSGLKGAMAKAFKTKNRSACLLVARIIFYVKTHFPKIYEKIN